MIFATQGDYGEIQCEKGCHDRAYDAVPMFRQMNQARRDCLIPSYMVPRCPVCGGNMAMHLRCDQHFVEDSHWNEAAVPESFGGRAVGINADIAGAVRDISEELRKERVIR